MNERKGYIITEITQSRGDGEEEEGPEKGERLLGCKRSWEFPSSGEGPFLLGTLGRPVLCIFHPRNKPSPHQNPTFGPILYKFIVMGPVRKPRPYKYISKNTNFLYAFNNIKIKNIQNVNMFFKSFLCLNIYRY